jgi:hypothetical protein
MYELDVQGDAAVVSEHGMDREGRHSQSCEDVCCASDAARECGGRVFLH